MKFKVGDLVQFRAAGYRCNDPVIIIKVSDSHGWGEERSYLVHIGTTGQRRWVTAGLIRHLARAS